MTMEFSDTHITEVKDLLSLIEKFGEVCQGIVCSGEERAEWIRERLHRFRYRKLKKKERGIVRRYLILMTGCDKRTISRHIEAYKKGEKVCRRYDRNSFSSVYTSEDRKLLAETDNAHGRLNGKATKNILKREYEFGDKRYERLSCISCAHIYNLRESRIYREHVQVQGKTQSIQSSIGERRKPRPNGEPGYIRVDTVHQGDEVDGTKGLYHINLVDQVTQFQVVVAVQGISEEFLKPVLEEAINEFPFIIKNFHSDNGSEFINKTVAKLLNKLHIQQTKSRPRKSNDNGLVESKNGSTIRKHLGHWHIPKKFAPRLNVFYREHFVPYLNYYRPCAFPVKKELENGKIKITYPQENYMTPLQKLLSIKNLSKYLKPSITKETLKNIPNKSPNQAAIDMQTAKKNFLKLALQKYSML